MKAFLYRHIAPVCLLLCAVVLLSAFIGVRSRAGAGEYRLMDISGDVTRLNDIAIRLLLEDGAHTQSLYLDGGVLTHRFSPAPAYAGWVETYYSLHQEFVEDKDADVRVDVSSERQPEFGQDTVRDIMTRAADRARVSAELTAFLTRAGSYKPRTVRVVTDLTVQDDAHPFVFTYDRLRYQYPATPPSEWDSDGSKEREDVSPYSEIGSETLDPRYLAVSGRAQQLYDADSAGRVYFTPEVLSNHTGGSAIYRVEEWSGDSYSMEPATRDGYEYYLPYYETPRGGVTEFASFPVRNMRMLRLDIAEDKICLLFIVDGMLTLRAYTPDGRLIAETPLYALDPDTIWQTNFTHNHDGGSAMLCYALWPEIPADPENPMQTLVCVELNDGRAALRSRIDRPLDTVGVAFAFDRWVLLRTGRAASDGLQDSLYGPLRYYLTLLDTAGNSLYEGEIVTDAAQDHLQYYGKTIHNSIGLAESFSPVRSLRFADDAISRR